MKAVNRALLSGLLLAGILLAGILLPGRALAGGQDHIRVVLDTSCSMGGYPGFAPLDEPRLAKLATLLLYDLAQPNLDGGDSSFEVIPFDTKYVWPAGDPAPRQTAPSIDPADGGSTREARRAHLVRELAALPYDADPTLYTPGLTEAFEDLRATPDPVYDRRVVVLITDGKPEEHSKPDREEALRKLLSQFPAEGIQLYILAFGPEANSAVGWYQDKLRAAGGTPDDLQADPDGSGMITAMSRIFARAFGYTYDGPIERMGRSGVDLLSGGAHEAERAMVVAAWDQPRHPGLELRTPTGRVPATDPGYILEGTGVSQHSYALLRVLDPTTGEYRLGATAPASDPAVQIGIFRPTELEIELVPPPGTPPGAVPKVMRKEAEELEVRVSPMGSSGTAVPPVDVTYKVYAGHWDSEHEDWLNTEHEGREQTWAATPGTTGGSRSGRVEVKFLHPHAPGQISYNGRLPLWVKKDGVPVGALDGVRSPIVEVYPYLDLEPKPNLDQLRKTGTRSGASSLDLGPGDQGCARFHIEVNEGVTGSPDQLPTFPGGRDTLSLVARVRLPAGVGTLPAELDGAELTLRAPDGTLATLDPAATPSAGKASWKTGIDLPREHFLGDAADPDRQYELCLRPLHARAAASGSLDIELVLNESPYDRFDVIGTYVVRYSLAPPLVSSAVAGLCCSLASLALLGLLVWLGRYRPDLPWDLHAAVGVEVEGLPPARLSAVSFGPPGLRERLGMVGPRDLPGAPGGPPLGTVTPVDRQLYRFQAGRGATELAPLALEPGDEAPEGSTEPPRLPLGGPVLLQVGRVYVLGTGGERWHLRVEYRR